MYLRNLEYIYTLYEQIWCFTRNTFINIGHADTRITVRVYTIDLFVRSRQFAKCLYFD